MVRISVWGYEQATRLEYLSRCSLGTSAEDVLRIISWWRCMQQSGIRRVHLLRTRSTVPINLRGPQIVLPSFKPIRLVKGSGRNTSASESYLNFGLVNWVVSSSMTSHHSDGQPKSQMCTIKSRICVTVSVDCFLLCLFFYFIVFLGGHDPDTTWVVHRFVQHTSIHFWKLYRP